ncbi:MAG TPA: nitrous oxide reductase accessory protein NosL [Polyangiaceae bacterium]|jgi:nitrous oxide reductase accessory protein NosL
MRRLFYALALLVACKGTAAARCDHCGMKIDPKSPFTAELAIGDKVEHFDTPRCALSNWLAEKKQGTVRVQDYYDRKMRPASEVRFVIGSDVVGPMGPELVPVDEARVTKFEKDHGGTRALAANDIDEKALQP